MISKYTTYLEEKTHSVIIFLYKHLLLHFSFYQDHINLFWLIIIL